MSSPDLSSAIAPGAGGGGPEEVKLAVPMMVVGASGATISCAPSTCRVGRKKLRPSCPTLAMAVTVTVTGP